MTMPTTEQFELMQRLAAVYMDSGYYPALKKSQILAMMLRAHGLGLPVAEAPGLFSILHGKLTLSANAMATLMKRAGYTWIVTELTDDAVTVDIYGPERTALGTSRFTMADAQQAGIVENNRNWKIYPRNMLMARALSNAAKWYAPDAFGGAALYTPEELGDVQAPPMDLEPVTETEPTTIIQMPVAEDPEPVIDERTEDLADLDKPAKDDQPITKGMAQTLARKFDSLTGSKEEGKRYRQFAFSLLTGRKITSSNDLTRSEGKLAVHLVDAEATAMRELELNYDQWSEQRDAFIKEWSEGEYGDIWHIASLSDAKAFTAHIRTLPKAS